MNQLVPDPIWGTPAVCLSSKDDVQRRRARLYDSPRCGGKYIFHEPALMEVSQKIGSLTKCCLTENEKNEKCLLTSWIIEQRRNGTECPIITSDVVEDMKQRSRMSVSDRAGAILKYIQSETKELGRFINCSRSCWIEQPVYDNKPFDGISLTKEYKTYYNLLACSESSDHGELEFLLNYLKKRD